MLWDQSWLVCVNHGNSFSLCLRWAYNPLLGEKTQEENSWEFVDEFLCPFESCLGTRALSLLCPLRRCYVRKSHLNLWQPSYDWRKNQENCRDINSWLLILLSRLKALKLFASRLLKEIINILMVSLLVRFSVVCSPKHFKLTYHPSGLSLKCHFLREAFLKPPHQLIWYNLSTFLLVSHIIFVIICGMIVFLSGLSAPWEQRLWWGPRAHPSARHGSL